MRGFIRLGVMAAALCAPGVTSVAMAQDSTSSGLKFLVGAGVGYGSGGVHLSGVGGDSKPGGYLLGRVGLARHDRPFVVADLEWQGYSAPVPLLPDETKKSDFGAVSAVVGLAIYPAADFYLMPQVGAQFRSWSGPRADEFSDSGFAAGLNLGYHLKFGESFALAPEVMLRYAEISGPDTPSFRAIAFRVMGHWMF